MTSGPSLDNSVFNPTGFRNLVRSALTNGATNASVEPSDFDLNPDLMASHAARPPARPAAVLIPAIARPVVTLLFTLRTEHLTAHAGQIAFPGGKSEPYDADALATALREANEEIGLEATYVEPLGTLDRYLTGTGYQITPVIALVDPAAPLSLDPNEVADTFEVPLPFLMDPANFQKHTRRIGEVDRHFYAVPYADRFIWGATAGILHNMHRRLFAS